MKFTDFRHFQDDFKRDDLLSRFADWSEELVDLLEKRVFGGQFRAIIDFVMSLDDQPVSRLTEEEVEEQLTICSQHKFTFRQMQDELDLYSTRVEKQYKTWCAGLYLDAQTKILNTKTLLYNANKITKATVVATKDEIQNQFLVDNEQSNLLWCDFLQKIKRAYSLVKNIADDLESRAMILMSLRKKHYI